MVVIPGPKPIMPDFKGVNALWWWFQGPSPSCLISRDKFVVVVIPGPKPITKTEGNTGPKPLTKHYLQSPNL
jgi:hypothetical protein